MHFNQFQRNLAGVFQGVYAANGQVDGFVFGEGQGFFVAGDFGGAGHHNPVFGAVVVHLHAEFFAGFYGNAFYLVALAVVDGVVMAPGAVDHAV